MSSLGNVNSIPAVNSLPAPAVKKPQYWITTKLSNLFYGATPTPTLTPAPVGVPFRKVRKELFALLRSLPKTDAGRPLMTAKQFEKSAELILTNASEFAKELGALEGVAAPQPVILADIPRFEIPPLKPRPIATRISNYYNDATRSGNSSVKFGTEDSLRQIDHQALIVKTIVQNYAKFLLANNSAVVSGVFNLDTHPLTDSDALEFALFNRVLTNSAGQEYGTFTLDILNHLESFEQQIPEHRKEQIPILTIFKTIEILSHIYQGTIAETTNPIQMKLIEGGYTLQSQHILYEYQIPEDFKSITVLTTAKKTEPSDVMPLYCPFDFVKRFTVHDLSKQGDNFPEGNDFGDPYELTFGTVIKLHEALTLVKTLEPKNEDETPDSDSMEPSEILAADLAKFIQLAYDTPVKQKTEALDETTESVALTAINTPICSSSDLYEEGV